ncbi:MAG: ABC transporter substrate-binding protein, partial [Lachnospiraceae bacterium]
MKKKVIGALLSVAMVASLLVGCGSSASTEEAAAPAATEEAAPAAEAEAEAPAAESNGTKVGVAMPTKDLQRWNQDG